MSQHLSKVLNAAVILCALAQFTLAAPLQAAPVPVANDALQFPKPVGCVNDFAGKLSPVIRLQLAAQVESFVSRSNVGFSIVVMNAADLRGWTIENYTRQLATEWSVARPPQRYGVMLLVAIQEPNTGGYRDNLYHGGTRLEVSRSLEPHLSKERAARLIRAMREDFQAGRFDQAVTTGAQSVMATLAEKLHVASDNSSAPPATAPAPPLNYASAQSSDWNWWMLLPIVFVPLAILTIIILIVIRVVKGSAGRATRQQGSRPHTATRYGSQSSWNDPVNSPVVHGHASHWSSTDSSWSNSHSHTSSSWTSDASSASNSWTSSDAGSSSSDFGSSSGGDFGGGGASDSW